MSFENLNGGFNSIASCTRVRFARNVKGFKYLGLSNTDKKQIADMIWEALLKAPSLSCELEFINVDAGTMKAKALMEKHIISPEFFSSGGYLIKSKDNHIAIMIGEEDHIRLQVFGTGFCPKECTEVANKILTILEQSVEFDFDKKLGYLTSCPTNLGTGIRVSIMLHLYMLTARREMEEVINAFSRVGFTIRGAGGEGTAAEGAFYQLSNQITLGVTQEQILKGIIDATMTIVEREKAQRTKVLDNDDGTVLDKLLRSAAVLRGVHKIDTRESISRLSDVLLVLERGLISGIKPLDIYSTIIKTSPAVISIEKTLTPNERDILRADVLRKSIGKKIIFNE